MECLEFARKVVQLCVDSGHGQAAVEGHLQDVINVMDQMEG